MKQLYVLQTEVQNDFGTIRISVLKQIVDGDQVITVEPHRITIGPADDLNSIIAANSADLIQQGYPAIDMDDLKLAIALRKVALKSERVAGNVKQWKADRKAEAARLAAEAEATVAAEQAAAEKAAADEEAKFNARVAAAVVALTPST